MIINKAGRSRIGKYYVSRNPNGTFARWVRIAGEYHEKHQANEIEGPT